MAKEFSKQPPKYAIRMQWKLLLQECAVPPLHLSPSWKVLLCYYSKWQTHRTHTRTVRKGQVTGSANGKGTYRINAHKKRRLHSPLLWWVKPAKIRILGHATRMVWRLLLSRQHKHAHMLAALIGMHSALKALSLLSSVLQMHVCRWEGHWGDST